MNKKNCVSGILWAVFFLYFINLCGSLEAEASYWPRMISVIGLVLSVLSAAASAVKWKSEKGEETIVPFDSSQVKRTGVALILLVFWVALMNILGFLVSSVVCMAVLFVGYEPVKTRKNIIRDILVAVIFGVAMYGLFTALGISFPGGIFI